MTIDERMNIVVDRVFYERASEPWVRKNTVALREMLRIAANMGGSQAVDYLRSRATREERNEARKIFTEVACIEKGAK